MRQLIEHLGLNTLIITDIDAVNKSTRKKVQPKPGRDFITANNVLKEWHPKEESLDKLLELGEEEKEKPYKSFFSIRVAYQTCLQARFKLAEQSFTDLEKESIPNESLQNLRILENQVFTDENDFLNTIKKHVGDKQTLEYGKLILEHAHMEGDRNKGDESFVVFPRTFEDALTLQNVGFFRNANGLGLIKKFRDAVQENEDISEVHKALLKALENATKAEFALDMLYSEDPASIQVPEYIHNGLVWLENKLLQRQQEVLLIQSENAEAPERGAE